MSKKKISWVGRKSGIYVTCPGVWWHNGKAYMEMDGMPSPRFSSHKRCRTIKTARRLARGLLDRGAFAVEIERWYENGRFVEVMR